jgi:N6-L-threonylcarbamoyladenine synthase
MIILGIETSCDETAASIVEGNGEQVCVLSNVISSQINIHKKFGGVIPEVAAREHIKNILPVIDEAIKKSQPKADQPLAKKNLPDVIAVTVGPGLITSLIVGIETAKTLAFAWNLPIIPINHIEGHIYANWIEKKSKISAKENCASQRLVRPWRRSAFGGKNLPYQKSKILLPALILTVSGGHTSLVLMKSHGKMKTIGETRDDAAGEAFDKAAALMKLGYPGGPAISEKASKLEIRNSKLEIRLPRPMLDSESLDFSFSGLKTALRYALEKDKGWKKRLPEYACEFQQAIIDVLISKTLEAATRHKVGSIMLSGGVASNLELRKQFENAIKTEYPKVQFKIPNLDYCTDNAAMIAAAGYFKALRGKFVPIKRIKVDPSLEL